MPPSPARERRDEARKLVAQGIDSSAHKKTAKNTEDRTFEAVFREWLDKQKSALTANTHTNKQQRMETNALPYIGHLPVAEVNLGRGENASME